MADGSLTRDAAPATDAGHLVGLAAALVLGGGAAVAARAGDVALLVVVAVVQAVLIGTWFLAVSGPGRRGGALVALAAAAGADFAVTQWPHSRLGTLLPVLALAVPVMFVHQLARGAARVRLVESLSVVALLVLAVTALPAVSQLRHEFAADDLGGRVAGGVMAAVAGALVAGLLVDMVVSVPRFDPEVPRGLPALVVASAVGLAIGYVALRDVAAFEGGRAVLAGAACGILAGLASVAATFAVHTAHRTEASAQRLRPVFSVALALSAVAPGVFLVCLAIRS